MVKVSIIGSGNVAQHLIAAFLKSDEIELVQVFARNPRALLNIVEASNVTSELSALIEADLYIIAISDDAVQGVSRMLPFDNRLVVHTSGTLPADTIDAKNRSGVFYPIQTFSKRKPLDFAKIPVLIESSEPNDYAMLQKVAGAISHNITSLSFTQRQALHVAAVFVNNFTNHLFVLADKICNENQISFDLLRPLIHETAEKVMQLSPKDAQTGPAIRKDQSTIDAHLDLLSDQNQMNIYKTLTHSIQYESRL
ncbi:MAG TPA: Rossmann-like and DUF2520 domain-containing protein [Flavobacterium sp.]|jgi:predicted short-subunit dehydrogenase-like oxidoreductase (DUF2520 family)